MKIGLKVNSFLYINVYKEYKNSNSAKLTTIQRHIRLPVTAVTISVLNYLKSYQKE